MNTSAVSCATGYTDFYFACHVNYSELTYDDGSRFNVSLLFDEYLGLNKVTNATALNVIFTSDDIVGSFPAQITYAEEVGVLLF